MASTAHEAAAVRRPQTAQSTTQLMQALLRTVLRDPRGYFKLSQPFKSSPTAPFNDRFKMSVTLGSGIADWTLLLNARNPEAPPDFILDELSDAFIKYEELQTLRTWSLDQPTSLLDLLMEMRALFRHNRARRAIAFSNEKLGFELESLLGLEDESEIRLLDKEKLNVECVVPIRRSAGQASGGGAQQSEQAGEARGADAGKGREIIGHLVMILDQELTQVRTSLQYPETVSEELRAVCPGWEPGNTHVFDFVPMVQSRVLQKMQAMDGRKEALKCLSELLTPLHVDSALFLRSSFLIELDAVFEVVVHVRLTPSFPEEQPSLVLQSVSYLVDRQPIHDVILEYPYSPRWGARQIASQILAILPSKIREFRAKVQSTVGEATAP
mmetsp:Transcript_55201/g.130164  ORF Transcript_55201/g.130164 Transcript_55201/m.130164 type:complete len:384 (-) Transcript_55201:133-1284(-)